MRKTVIEPEAGNELVADVPDADETAYSRAVAVEFPSHERVYVSGVTPVEHAEDDVRAQTRDVLETIERILASRDGTMRDVVRVRVFVQDAIDLDFADIHAVRSEFFEHEHLPASTLVEVDQLVRGRIEVETEAVIPVDGWEPETVSL